MRFDRLRFRQHGRVYPGSIVSAFSELIPDTGTPEGFSGNTDGRKGFDHEICGDIDKGRYDGFGVEQMHDLWLDKVRITKGAYVDVDYSDNDGITQQDLSLRQFDILWGRSYLERPYLADEIGALPQTLIGQVAGYDLPDPSILRFSPDYSTELDDMLQHMDLSALFSPFTTLLSKADVLQPAINAPGFLWESLKDMPALVWERGLTLFKLTGGLNLKWEFGWKPLLADLKRLISHNENLAKRLKLIAQLRASRTVTNKVALEKHEDTEHRDVVIYLGIGYFSNDVGLKFDVTVKTEMERWGCVQYSAPDLSTPSNVSHLTAAEKKWEAIRTLYGLYWKNPSALWEILPWSWMVDWLVPIQQMLDHHSNLIKLTVEQGAIMTRTTSTFTATLSEVLSDASAVSVDPASCAFEIVRTTKERLIINDPDSLPTSIHGRPFLDLRKLGIMISLVLQRIR